MIRPEQIFYQGEPGAYSQLAALSVFPGSKPEGLPAFADVFDRLASEKGNVAAVLPIENSIYGSVHPVLDLLQTNPFPIVGEFKLRIQHCLLAHPSTPVSAIREVYSHPQALGQCESFFRQNPQMKPVPWPDTAGAARYLADHPELTTTGAIASEQAGLEYKLAVLQKNIESFDHNFTRFVVVTPQPEPVPDANKTSIWFEAKDLPGSLYNCLGCFASREINLIKIENRPVWGKAWKQIFYLDITGGLHQPAIREAIEELHAFTESVHILGSYREDQSEKGHVSGL